MKMKKQNSLDPLLGCRVFQPPGDAHVNFLTIVRFAVDDYPADYLYNNMKPTITYIQKS